MVSKMKTRYYTYNEQGVVSKHYILITALLKCLYQALILGFDSGVDRMNHSKDYYRSIFFVKGWKPFKIKKW